MRKAIILGVVGLFMASGGAWAMGDCGGTHSASKGQTVADGQGLVVAANAQQVPGLVESLDNAQAVLLAKPGPGIGHGAALAAGTAPHLDARCLEASAP